MKVSPLHVGLVGVALWLLFRTTTREGFAQYEQKCPDGSTPRFRMIASDRPPEFYCSSGVGEKVCPASHPFPYKEDSNTTRCEKSTRSKDGVLPVCPTGFTNVGNDKTGKWQCEKITPIQCSGGGKVLVTLMPGRFFGQIDSIDKVLCVPSDIPYVPRPEDIAEATKTQPADLTKLCKNPGDILAMDLTARPEPRCIPPPEVAPPPASSPPASSPPASSPPASSPEPSASSPTSIPADVRNIPISELGPTSSLQNLIDSLKPFRPPTAPSSDLEKERKAILAITQKDMFFVQIALFLSVLSMLGYLVLPTDYAHGITLLFLSVAISFGFFLRKV